MDASAAGVAPTDPPATDAPSARIPRPAFLDLPAVAAVLAALPGSRAVGGAVRDALANREVADVDVAAPLPPEETNRRLRAAGLRVHETGLSHGTVTATLHGVPVEVTSLRRDVETDGRHAVVEWTTDWREDASRRDFTMNALSLSARGDLWDYFDGRADLAAGRVRFVGDPATRLAEDALRALRWFRFHARYGRGDPDPAALAAIREAAPRLHRLSVERIWSELKRILAVPDPADAVARMDGTGVLPALLGDAARFAARHVAALTAIGAPPDPLLRFDAMLNPRAVATASRLRASNEELDLLRARYRADHALTPAQPAIADDAFGDDDLRRLLATESPPDVTAATWLRQGMNRAWDWRGPSGAAWDAFRARVAATPVPIFPLRGRDALDLGLTPGPDLGRLLAATRAWWMEGGCTADADTCRARLRALIADIPPKGFSSERTDGIPPRTLKDAASE